MAPTAKPAAKAKMQTLPAGNKLHAVKIAGFTLIEVLVVLVILALTMAVVVPAISKTRGESITDVAREVQATLRKARSDAVLTQRTHAVLVDVKGKRFWQQAHRKDKRIPEKITVSVNVASSETRNGTAGIVFFPDGSSTGGFIRLSMGESSSKIAVDWLTGRISVTQKDS